MIRNCTKCRTEKPLSAFRERKPGKFQARCKSCEYNQVKKWQQENRDKVAVYRRKSLYGLTDEEYNRMLDKQYECCAVCDLIMDPPHVDHDHETGKVRALLCYKCNAALGLVGDDIEVLENLIKYLKSHSD